MLATLRVVGLAGERMRIKQYGMNCTPPRRSRAAP
jgi:hypothetical protein